MFRGVLLVVLTMAALLATVGAVVGLGYRHLAASRQAADAGWTAPVKPAAGAPTTTSATEPAEMTADSQPTTMSSSIELWAKDAILHGAVRVTDVKNDRNPKRQPPPKNPRVAEQLRQRELMAGHAVTSCLTSFNSPEDAVEWAVEIPKAGSYEIDLDYSSLKSSHNGELVIRIADKELTAGLDPTRSARNFRVVTLGSLALEAGKTTLLLRPTTSNAPLNVRSVRLIAAE